MVIFADFLEINIRNRGLLYKNGNGLFSIRTAKISMVRTIILKVDTKNGGLKIYSITFLECRVEIDLVVIKLKMIGINALFAIIYFGILF